MSRRVKTRRQRKRASGKENGAKGEHTSQPEEKSGSLESSAIADENLLTKHINRPPLVSSSKKDKKEVKKKAVHKRDRKPKGTRNVGELENALDKDEGNDSSSGHTNVDKDEGNDSSVDLAGHTNVDELLYQIWKDIDEIYPDVTKGGLAPNVDWVKQPANIKSSYKLVKKNAAFHRARTSRETRNAWKPRNRLEKDLEQILKELNELLPPSEEAVAKLPDEAIAANKNLIKKKATHQCGGNPERTFNVCELDKDEKPYSTSTLLSIIDEEELNQILKDLQEIFPSCDEAVAPCGLSPEVEWENKSGNLESNLANGPPLVSPSEEEKYEATGTSDKLTMKKAAHHRNGTSKGTHNAWKLENGYPLVSPSVKEKYEATATTDKLTMKKAAHRRNGTSKGPRHARELGHPSHFQEEYSSSDLLSDKVDLYPNTDCFAPGGLVGDSGPVPPKFFGNSGYFILTGTNSQLQQQMQDLAARNIFVESFVVLPDALADIVEQQLTDLVENSDPILGKMREPRRVPRQKKQRKYPKKTEN